MSWQPLPWPWGAFRKKPFVHAADLVLDKVVDPFWHALRGSRVSAFEDTAGGLQSALSARQVLDKSGIPIYLDLYGIAANPQKAQVLQAVGAAIFSEINPALQTCLKRSGPPNTQSG